MALVKCRLAVAAAAAAAAACQLQCLGGGMCCCVSLSCTHDKRSQWNVTLCHKTLCSSTGCHAAFNCMGIHPFIIVKIIV